MPLHSATRIETVSVPVMIPSVAEKMTLIRDKRGSWLLAVVCIRLHIGHDGAPAQGSGQCFLSLYWSQWDKKTPAGHSA